MADFVVPLEVTPLDLGFGVGGQPPLGGVLPPELQPTPPPVIDITPIAPIDVPPDPFPGAPVVEPPPLPGPPSGPPEPLPVPPPTTEPPIVYPMPPGAPGTPEQPIQVTGTGQLPQPPPFPEPPPGPVIQLPPPVTVTETSAGTGAVAIATASIDQSIQIMNQDVSPLATAVEQGIQLGAQDASTIAQQSVQAITASLDGFTNGLFGWVQSLWQWIKDNIGPILTAIGRAVEDAAKALLDAIRQGLQDIGKFFTDTIGPILTRIGKAVDNIAKFYDQHIRPILTVIAQVERTVAAAIVAIQKDINSGLQGLLRLPGDLANALSSIGNELIRAGQALKVTNVSVGSQVMFGQDGPPPGGFSKVFSDAIAGIGQPVGKTTFSPGGETLIEPTLAEDLPKVLQAMIQITKDVVVGFKNVLVNPETASELLVLLGVGIWADALEPIELLLFLWEIMKAPIGVIGELAAETTRTILPLSKIDPAALANAWQRSFITADQMDAEMLTQGYNRDRSKLLRDLTRHVEDVASLVDYRFRGIIADDDFVSGLRDLGFTETQIAALREDSYQIFDTARAIDAHRRGLIDDQAFNEVLAVNRYDDAQATVIKTLAYRPPLPDEILQANLRRVFAGSIAISSSELDAIDPDFAHACHDAGLNPDATRALWWAGWNTLDAGAWINLYFRGIRTRDQVHSKLTELRVPSFLQQDLIDSQRPLIPFRTIPAMVTAGLMSESDAIAYLEKHGYSLEDAVLLMKYATRQNKGSKAATATAQKGISEAQAKTAYEDGLINRDQYLALLQDHGWSIDAATLEIRLTDMSIETKDRKQVGVDIVNEFQAGLIDQQTAIQQIAQSGYTPAEQAMVLKKLTSARSQKAKTPTEPELRAFVKADIISADDYQQNLVVLGYSSAWAAAFRALHFPVAAQLVPAPA